MLLQVFKEIVSEMKLEPDEIYLAQGTLRPDLIESASSLASSNASVIKTHHNDTQLVRQLRQQVCQFFDFCNFIVVIDMLGIIGITLLSTDCLKTA